MHKTVGEIRALLFGLPDDLPVQFTPISMAWTGTAGAMRVSDRHVFANMEFAQPDDEGAELTIYIAEEPELNP